MDFGQVAVGLTHGEQVQVFNVGSAPLNVLGATVDSPEFAVYGSFPTLVQPSDSTSLSVRFTPASVDGGQATTRETSQR
jgi:hypothetical protein